MTVRREATFEVPMAAGTLADRAIPALTALGLNEVRRDGLTIKARRGLNWRSFGEHITVSLSESAPGRTHVKVESASVVVTTIFDWGSGARNVREVEAALMKAAGATTAT